MQAKNNTRLLGEICHFLQEIAHCSNCLDTLVGAARETKRREWQELSETLDSKMKAARYFRHQELLFIKYLGPSTIEVVLTPDCLSREVLNGRWMDTICDSVIVDERDYLEALGAVFVEEGELYAE